MADRKLRELTARVKLSDGTYKTNNYELVQGDGSYPDMTAGQLNTSIHDTDLVPYVFRKTPFRSTRETEKLVGASVAWNQFVDPKEGSIRGITVTASNGKITWSGAATSNGGRTINIYNYLVPVVSGHKYALFSTMPLMPLTALSKNSDTSVYFYLVTAGNNAGIAEATFTGDAIIGHSFVNGTDYSGSGYIILTDLTLALGSTIADYIYTLESGTAGAGVAKLREWGFFDKPYYAYNAGAIESVNVSKHRMTGLNQWDEEWELGNVNSYGEKVSSTSRIMSKNLIPIFPNTQYYAIDPTNGNNIIFYYYDSGGSYIGNSGWFGNTTKTTPANARYMYAVFGTSYGTTYKNDICINLSNPSVNGTYAPYEVHEYPLADITLRGILKLDGSNNLYADGDVYESDGTVTRRYIDINLGELTWNINNHATYGTFFYADVTSLGIKRQGAFTNAYDAVCNKYQISKKTAAGFVDQSLLLDGGSNNVTQIQVKDSTYSTKEAFKTAMQDQNVHLVVEVATPTTETTDPYTEVQVCSPYGTEEYVDRAVAAGTRDVAVPVGHETEYAKDIVGAIEGIPFPPSSNGTYSLKVTVASGVPTYSWVSE